MKRKIVTIDENKCNGCGLCVNACHEGALQIVNGKAKLISDSYCDGLGNCLPECPTGAITIIEREALEYDEEAVKRNMQSKLAAKESNVPCGCPGSRARSIKPKEETHVNTACALSGIKPQSQLKQWPCQIRLVPAGAPYFDNAHLLIAADCTAYAYANIHSDFMQGKITIIGCPKLDDVDYSEKLTSIFTSHDIKSVTVLRMEVPCCGGIVYAVRQALANCNKEIPLNVVTISIDGEILNV